MQKTVEQAGQWEAIWARQGLLDSFIDVGRSIYNVFWRSVLRRYLTPNTRMIEFGCGRASLTLSIAPEIKMLSGVDISDVAVRQAAESAQALGVTNARFAVGDCTKLPQDEKYDFV